MIVADNSINFYYFSISFLEYMYIEGWNKNVKKTTHNYKTLHCPFSIFSWKIEI